MIFEQIDTGGDRNYGYLIADPDTREAALVDPSPNPHPCIERVRELDLKVLYLINTHTHPDHTGGNEQVQTACGCAVVTHESAPFGDVRVGDRTPALQVGGLVFNFLHTPGHTPDSICVHVGNELITGDTLFVGKVGGTATKEQARTEFQSLRILMELEDEIRVWPGHNFGVKPHSTIGHERETNPFILRLEDFDAFYWLKLNWADYKIKHGIQ